ncbi:hypothetical protein U1Q18_043025, partial [Sarracenia purpurea var. burkii]
RASRTEPSTDRLAELIDTRFDRMIAHIDTLHTELTDRVNTWLNTFESCFGALETQLHDLSDSHKLLRGQM